TEKGNALAIVTVCSALSPPARRKIICEVLRWYERYYIKEPNAYWVLFSLSVLLAGRDITGV
ncbi:hypothetical protein MZC44_24625, partial [Escherichia coli]|nr:hypothetical protein [Escherichia coli]